jgi:Flp pilus assembly protein TadD
MAALAVAATPEPAGVRVSRPIRPLAAAGAGVVGLAVVVALALPWLSQRKVDQAGRLFARHPGAAIARLRSAADLNALDRRPLVIEGSAWLRLGDPGRARTAFAAALRRDPGDAYSTLVLGAIASAQGDAGSARRLLTRAVRLSPRDPTARAALSVVRSGRMIDLARLQARIRGLAAGFRAGTGAR